MSDTDAVRIGVLVNSALYLSLVFVAGLFFGVPLAWKGAVATAGVVYLAYFAQEAAIMRQSKVIWHAAVALVLLSIALGAGAGIALL